MTKTPSFRGALVYPSANQTLTAGTITIASWDSETYDTDSIHNPADNNKLTVPAGVTKVRLTVNSVIDGAANGVEVSIRKNNGAFIGGGGAMIYGTTDMRYYNISSAVLSVIPGDYFTAAYGSQAASDVLYASRTVLYETHYSWFTMEIIE